MVDLGTVDFRQLNALALSGGDRWYACRAARRGLFTAEVTSPASGVTLRLYDANQVALTGPARRIDWPVEAGQPLFVQVRYANAQAAVRLVNLVDRDASALRVYGTRSADQFLFDAAAPGSLSINGVTYAVSSPLPTLVAFDGGAGADQATLRGTGGADTAVLRANSLRLTAGGRTITAARVESIRVEAGAGNDRLTCYDSPGNDRLEASPTTAAWSGPGFSHVAIGFETVDAYALAGGIDTAVLNDSPAADRFDGRPTLAVLQGNGFCLRASSFDEVRATANAGGYDTARIFDTAGDDFLEAAGRSVRLSTRRPELELLYELIAFDRVQANRSTGNDTRRIASDVTYLELSPGWLDLPA